MHDGACAPSDKEESFDLNVQWHQAIYYPYTEVVSKNLQKTTKIYLPFFFQKIQHVVGSLLIIRKFHSLCTSYSNRQCGSEIQLPASRALEPKTPQHVLQHIYDANLSWRMNTISTRSLLSQKMNALPSCPKH